MSNYPPGFNPISVRYLDLSCPHCGYQWEVKALVELGTLVTDISQCPECGKKIDNED